MPAIPYISSATPTSNFILAHSPPSYPHSPPPATFSKYASTEITLQFSSKFYFFPNHMHRPRYNDHSYAHLPATFPSRSHRSSSVSLTVRPLFTSLISPAHWQSPHPNPFYDSLHPCQHRLLYLERSPITLVSAPFIFLAPPLTILRNLPLCTS